MLLSVGCRLKNEDFDGNYEAITSQEGCRDHNVYGLFIEIFKTSPGENIISSSLDSWFTRDIWWYRPLHLFSKTDRVSGGRLHEPTEYP